MSIKMTFDMGRDDALAFLADHVPDGRDVTVTREMNTLRVIVPIRPWWAELAFVTWVLREKELATMTVSNDPKRDDQSVVELTSKGAPPWLYRRLVKLLDEHSVERKEVDASRRESPFSLENMWGGPRPPEPGQEPPKPLGFGADFFGGPSSKKGYVKPERVAPKDSTEAGAFTRARDAGEF